MFSCFAAAVYRLLEVVQPVSGLAQYLNVFELRI